jgi:hypothetical protein
MGFVSKQHACDPLLYITCLLQAMFLVNCVLPRSRSGSGIGMKPVAETLCNETALCSQQLDERSNHRNIVEIKLLILITL